MGLIVDNASRPATLPQGGVSPTTHRVQPGEGAYDVSRQYGIRPDALVSANPQIRDTSRPLPPGDVLQLPQDPESRLETHALENGETMEDVARAHGVDVPELLSLNGIDNPDGVYPGAVLLLPGTAGDASTTSCATDADGGEIADSATQSVQQAGEVRQRALEAVGVPVEDWTSAEAAQYTDILAQAAEDDPELADVLIVMSENELQRSAELLGNATENKDDAEADVKALAANVSRLGNAASPEAAATLAYAIAEEIPESSEQTWVDDGFGEYADDSGDERFLALVGAALDAQGKGQAADEMLHKSAGGVFGEGGLLDDIGGVVVGTFDAITDFPGDVWDFARDHLLNPVGDRLREAISDVLDIEGRLARLESPGDSVVLTADVEGTLLGVEVGVGATVRVERTEEGYALELSGEGSLGVAAELGLPGLPSGNLEATGSASATVRFEFDTLADATRAAEIVAATGVGTALAGTPAAPVGGVLLASQADDFGFIAGHYAQTTLQLESEASISADLAEELGLPGAEFSGAVSNVVAIELPRDGVPRLVVEQSLSVEGDLDLSGPFTLPDGSTVNPANVGSSGKLSLRTEIPIDVGIDELVDDPLGELQDAGRTALGGAETTLSGSFSFEQGVSMRGGGVELEGNEGIQVDISATVPTLELGGAIGRAFTGDLAGAIGALGENAEISGTVRAYEENSFGIGDSPEQTDGDNNTDPDGVVVGVPTVASVEVTARYSERTSEILVDFEGSPEQLLADFGGFLGNVTYIAS